MQAVVQQREDRIDRLLAKFEELRTHYNNCTDSQCHVRRLFE